jgi:pimeloyl-ACP methyl ester carboxylesterase
MTIEKNQVLNRKNSKPILYDTYFPEPGTPKPLVIFCHGYKGFKDWGAWDLVAKEFARRGFFFVKFNFSHNGGTLNQPVDFPDPEAFAQNNYSKELDDLSDLLEHLLSSKNRKKDIDSTKVFLIGHSRGGGIAHIKTEEDTRIKKVATWASLSDFKARFQEGSDAFIQWKKSGVTYIENSRTQQQLPQYFQFYEDFVVNSNRLTISRAVKQLKVPQLIIHGTEDPTVSVKEAKAIHSWNPESKLKIIPEADHVFGAKHPWTQFHLPEDLTYAVDETIRFFK